MNDIFDEETPRCAKCHTLKDLCAVPIKTAGLFIGHLFLCDDCAEGLVSVEIELEGTVMPTGDVAIAA